MHFCWRCKLPSSSMFTAVLISLAAFIASCYVHILSFAYSDSFLPVFRFVSSALSMCLPTMLLVNARHVLFKSKKLTVKTSFMVESNEHFSCLPPTSLWGGSFPFASRRWMAKENAVGLTVAIKYSLALEHHNLLGKSIMMGFMLAPFVMEMISDGGAFMWGDSQWFERRSHKGQFIRYCPTLAIRCGVECSFIMPLSLL